VPAGGDLPAAWDYAAVSQHFAARPGVVAARSLQIAAESAGFLAQLALDRTLQRGGRDTGEVRARQLRALLERLGPAFMKCGQAVSIRVDLLPAAYLRELRELQDNVPPFPSDQARGILERELAGSGGVDGVFESLSAEPVAAATLGQVYRGRLRADAPGLGGYAGGREVAVKVQRPDMLEAISLDLMILRSFAPLLRRSLGLNSDVAGLVDEWGRGFVAELDYRTEGVRAVEFAEAMRRRNIDTVTSAEPALGLSTGQVLVSEWMEGERLEQSSSEDVAKLCGVALTAYLTMLLDTGTLHADPHPGNLMRTQDGRLCILDWGLTTEVTRDQQYAIIEYISHLVSEDYAKVPKDLVKLGFVPESKVQAMEDSDVATALSYVFRQLAAGGGAKEIAGRINVADIGVEVSALKDKYGNILQIPTYFAYILRSFSILEGIGLSNNPDYQIVQGCYPYIARRLFNDDSERAKAALRAMLYTPGKGGDQLNARRLVKLAGAFRSYTDQRMSKLGDEGRLADSQVFREALGILFSQNGNNLQDIVLREMARSIDTAGRRLLTDPAVSPLPLLLQGNPALRAQVEALTVEAEDDEIVMDSLTVFLRYLADEAEALQARPEGSREAREVVNDFLPTVQEMAPELAPGAVSTFVRFNAYLLERVSSRILAGGRAARG